MQRVYVVGTMDTKGAELRYAAERVRAAGAETVLVDVGTQEAGEGADVTAMSVAAYHPDGVTAVFGLGDRGKSVSAMAKALTAYLASRDDIGAVLGLGGTGNTALVTEAMRTLPIGTPKLMVSTVASGNTAPYVGPNDLAMMYSVVDVAGLNAIPTDVYEAARIDGASPWKIWRLITVPLLRPAILVATVLNMIYVFNSFPIIYTLNESNPGFSHDTTITFMYKLAFKSAEKDVGQSAAAGLFNVCLILVAVLVYLRVSRWREEES